MWKLTKLDSGADVLKRSIHDLAGVSHIRPEVGCCLTDHIFAAEA